MKSVSLVFILYGTETQVNECLNFYYIVNYPKDQLKLCILQKKEYDLKKYQNLISKLVTNDDIEALYKEIPNCNLNSDLTFVIDNVSILTNPECLNILVNTLELDNNKLVVAPMIHREGLLWANYWGAISENGYYARSENYSDILNRTTKSVFNVPYVNVAYLFDNRIHEICNMYTLVNNFCIDMSVCHNLRESKIDMYVINTEYFGFLLELAPVTLSDVTNSDLARSWEDKYLHKLFRNFIRGHNLDYMELCGDTFQIPLFTDEFCQELIELAEQSDEWSGGSKSKDTYDPRLNAYENVPTQDIHLTQLGLDSQWRHIVHTYISRIASKLYSQYKTHGPNITFVVKYTPDGQPDLMPHHDSSVYTINVALNTYGKDYEGGGCRFIRQNYTVKGNPPGYCLMHPGRLTHYHEGLPTTAGTRYILVSFIN